MGQEISRYIIRVYAIIFNQENQLLLSDEYQLNMRMTKFPGGGLEFGEGALDCLKREAIEELGQEIEILEHFYTTDYFQQANFYPDAQLISIYYRAKLKELVKFKVSDKAFNFDEEKNGAQSFRWVNLSDLNINDLTFPVDKEVARMIKQKFETNDKF